MDFFKSKMGLAAMVVSLLIIAAVVWLLLSAGSRSSSPEGTLVSVPRQEVVM